MFSKTWPDGLEIREITAEVQAQIVMPAHARIFEHERPRFSLDSIYNDDQKQKLKVLQTDLNKGTYILRLGAFWNGTFAGWHFGRQSGIDQFYMTNSAVLPEFRRRKIYERILESTVQCVVAKGFQCITSQHHPTNNAVIIPKLKIGFCVAGVELTDGFGLTVMLKWYPHELQRDVFEFRSGYSLPSPFVKEHLLKLR